MRDGKVIGSQVVDKKRFMFCAMGYWPSLVNPQRKDLFAENEVKNCFLLEDDYGKITGYYTPPFDSLWKIRYNENPYEYEQYGWSQGKFSPSSGQIKYLYERYGVRNVQSEYIYGDSLYKLLQDVQRSDWVTAYKTIPVGP